MLAIAHSSHAHTHTQRVRSAKRKCSASRNECTQNLSFVIKCEIDTLEIWFSFATLAWATLQSAHISLWRNENQLFKGIATPSIRVRCLFLFRSRRNQTWPSQHYDYLRSSIFLPWIISKYSENFPYFRHRSNEIEKPFWQTNIRRRYENLSRRCHAVSHTSADDPVRQHGISRIGEQWTSASTFNPHSASFYPEPGIKSNERKTTVKSFFRK